MNQIREKSFGFRVGKRVKFALVQEVMHFHRCNGHGGASALFNGNARQGTEKLYRSIKARLAT
jgi:hypothetical protein